MLCADVLARLPLSPPLSLSLSLSLPLTHSLTLTYSLSLSLPPSTIAVYSTAPLVVVVFDAKKRKVSNFL